MVWWCKNSLLTTVSTLWLVLRNHWSTFKGVIHCIACQLNCWTAETNLRKYSCTIITLRLIKGHCGSNIKAHQPIVERLMYGLAVLIFPTSFDELDRGGQPFWPRGPRRFMNLAVYGYFTVKCVFLESVISDVAYLNEARGITDFWRLMIVWK